MRLAISIGLLIGISMAFAIRINEVFYDPRGTENSQEFVEVYSMENLSSYVFGDKARNQTLQLVQWTENPYALVVAESYDRSNPNITFYTTGSMIGNGLSNTGDAVFLYFNHTLLDWMEYNKSAAPEGYSIERTEPGWEVSYLLGGTPGFGRLVQNTTTSSENEDTIEEQPEPSNITMKIWTDKLIYKPGEKMKLALEWSEPGQTAQVEIRNLEGEVLRSYELSSKLITYKITKNTSALWIHADAINLSDGRVVGVLMPVTQTETKTCAAKKPSCPKPIPPKDPVQIISFYTRAKKYQEKIKLYLHLEGQGNYTLLVESPLETISKNITLNETYEDSLEVRPLPNKNMFTAQVSNADYSFDRILVFFLESENQTSPLTITNFTQQVPVHSLPPTQPENTQKPIVINTQDLKSPEMPYLSYGLLILLALIIFVFYKEYQTHKALLQKG